jgi:hypothetical protein
MRNELEIIEKIERYLAGELSAEEKAAFDQQLANDPELREDVRVQQDIMNGIARAGWRDRIRLARRRYFWRRQLLRGGLGIGIVVVVTVLIGRFGPGVGYSGEMATLLNTAISKALPAHGFQIDATRDTVIETKGGIVFSIPARVFLQADGKPASGAIDLEVREALDPAVIMRAGLSTRSEGRLLETAGMFYLQARQGESTLKVDSSKGIYAEIPTDTVKPGMQLFTGKRRADGTIDWVNPRPLYHDLMPVDILSLDFYPPHYLDSLRVWGYDSRNKRFTDSLYYSLAQFFVKKETTIKQSYGDSSVEKTYYMRPDCGINPVDIKVIWDQQYQNTLIATREFEERLAWIHRSDDKHVLDLYLNNLDKNLSDIDSMAIPLLAGEQNGWMLPTFKEFYERHDGKVKNGSRQFDMLRAYYQQRSKAFTAAIMATERAYWDKQAALDDKASRKASQHEEDDFKRRNENLTEELKLNLKKVYQQLGYDTIIGLPPRDVYKVQLIATGWYNIDKYVVEATVDRRSVQIEDSHSGKTAAIEYRPVTIRVAQPQAYDRIFVYLLPDKLSSFMRLEEANGSYTEKLNGFIKYGLVCLAYKGEQAYFYQQQEIATGEQVPVGLTSIGKEELDRQLMAVGSGEQATDLQRENAYFRFEIQDERRQKRNEAMRDLQQRLMEMISPCYDRPAVFMSNVGYGEFVPASQ